MTQARHTSIAGGLVLGLTALCSTPALAGDGDDRQASQQWHSEHFTARRMFVGNRATDEVDAYDRKGDWVLSLTGFTVPFGMDVDEGDLYVVSQGSNEVYVYRDHGHASTDHGAPRLKLLVEGGSGGLQRPFYTTVGDDML